jgi:pyrroloquinoline-quinone synthase
MTNYLAESLESSLRDRKLLSHPFYRRWEAGELSSDELRLYAEQYRFFERMLPRFLERLARELPEGFARDSVLSNLADEVATPTHLELFERFARYLNATDAPISPAMQRLVGAYSDVLAEGPAVALAGLWAYESQGAAVADSKGEGLARHYGAGVDATAFWTVHGSLEGDHAKWTFEALESLEPDVDEVGPAARRIADAWWSFLDERESLAA